MSTFYGLLKILSTMAGGSHVVAEALLQVHNGGCRPCVQPREMLAAATQLARLCAYAFPRPACSPLALAMGTAPLQACSLLRQLHSPSATSPAPCLQAGISGTLRNLLATSSLLSTSTVSPGNVLRSAEQLGDLVALSAALLPPIPDAAAAMLQEVPPSPSFGAPCDSAVCNPVG